MNAKNKSNDEQREKMTYAYIRVSTDKQDTTVQKYEINSYANINGIKIDKFVEEKVSGTVEFEQRNLGKMLKKTKKGDTIICTEISRIGRTMKSIAKIMCLCVDKGIKLIAMKENYVLDDNPSSKLILSVYSFTAETERNLISERTKEGLAARKRSGIKLGRPVGAKNKKYKLDPYKERIIKMLSKGCKKTVIARRFK